MSPSGIKKERKLCNLHQNNQKRMEKVRNPRIGSEHWHHLNTELNLNECNIYVYLFQASLLSAYDVNFSKPIHEFNEASVKMLIEFFQV